MRTAPIQWITVPSWPAMRWLNVASLIFQIFQRTTYGS